MRPLSFATRETTRRRSCGSDTAEIGRGRVHPRPASRRREHRHAPRAGPAPGASTTTPTRPDKPRTTCGSWATRSTPPAPIVVAGGRGGRVGCASAGRCRPTRSAARRRSSCVSLPSRRRGTRGWDRVPGRGSSRPATCSAEARAQPPRRCTAAPRPTGAEIRLARRQRDQTGGCCGLARGGCERARPGTGGAAQARPPLRPAALTEQGLGPAIRAAVQRLSIESDISVPDSPRLPENIEATVAYIVLEALGDLTRRAEATRARVTVQTR